MNRMAKAGLITMIGGIVFAFFPLVFALVSSAITGGNPFSESEGSGSAIWLMIVTLPLGGIAGIVGLVLLVVGQSKK